MEPVIGQIMLFGGNFAPLGWALCNGQLLPISNNSSLFSILGTTYGGNGRTTFALPDMRGRVPMHAGSGIGLTPRQIGQYVGTESVNSDGVEPGVTGTVAAVGDGQPDNNMQPTICMNYIIALQGVYPQA